MTDKVKNYAVHPTFQMDLQTVWMEQPDLVVARWIRHFRVTCRELLNHYERE